MKFLGLRDSIVTSFLCIIALGILMFIYLSLDGVLFRKPLVFSKDAVTTKKIYNQGDTVSAKFSYCKNRNLVGTVEWEMIDGEIRAFADRKYSGPIGCFKNRLIVLTKIPADVPNGSYYFNGIISYKVNSLNTVSIPIKTNKFKVQ